MPIKAWTCLLRLDGHLPGERTPDRHGLRTPRGRGSRSHPSPVGRVGPVLLGPQMDSMYKASTPRSRAELDSQASSFLRYFVLFVPPDICRTSSAQSPTSICPRPASLVSCASSASSCYVSSHSVSRVEIHQTTDHSVLEYSVFSGIRTGRGRDDRGVHLHDSPHRPDQPIRRSNVAVDVCQCFRCVQHRCWCDHGAYRSSRVSMFVACLPPGETSAKVSIAG